MTTSCHALVLALMRRHNGMTSAQFYKGDAERYVRLNLFVQRLLGLLRLTVGRPVYAFGAEALGQTMMYPDDQASGSDPGAPLVTLDGWRDVPAFDAENEIVRLIRESRLPPAGSPASNRWRICPDPTAWPPKSSGRKR